MGQNKHTQKRSNVKCKREGEGEGNGRRVWIKGLENIDRRTAQQSAHPCIEGSVGVIGWETAERERGGGWRTVVSLIRRDFSHSLTPFRSRLTPTKPSFPRLLISWSGFTTNLWWEKRQKHMLHVNKTNRYHQLCLKASEGFVEVSDRQV